jgi:hypothetical protein
MGEPLEQPVGYHGARATPVFLVRLEDEHRRSVEGSLSGEVQRCAKKHGCMTVMSTGMHGIGRRRCISEIILFRDRQGVHLGPDGNGAAACPALKHPDNAGAANTFVDSDPGRTQMRGDYARRPLLAESEFRIAMQVMPPFAHLPTQVLGETCPCRSFRCARRFHAEFVLFLPVCAA